MKTKTSHAIRRTQKQSIVSIFSRILFCPLLLLISANVSRATDHCGTIGLITPEHWTQADAPHRVTCDIIVNNLTIDPGVTVYFTGSYQFEVDGYLHASGTPTQPIVFTSTNGVGWRGIYFLNYGLPSELNWCRISNSINSGIRVQDSWPTIQNCVISSNTSAAGGGGISISISTANDLVLQNCTIVNNTAQCSGGGINASITPPGTLRLQGTTVAGNTVYASCFRKGGGLYIACNAVLESNSIVTANIISGTGSYSSYGSGLYCNSGTTILRNTLVCSNSYSTDSPAGTGVYLNSGQLFATNSIISDNTGNGALYVNGGSAVLVNCTVAYNTSLGLNVAGGTATALNSIFFNNAWNGTSYGAQIAGTTNVTYCDVQGGGYTGFSNITFSPFFLGPGVNFMLSPSSPCIDAGSTNPIYNDVCFPPSQGTARNDMGAYGGPGACGWYLPPVICVPSANQYAVTNTSVCISAGAAGASPLSYQWYNGTTLLSGETGSSLCFSSVQLANQGSYYCVVTNVYGAVTSTPAVLYVTTNGAAILDVAMYAGVDVAGLPGRTYVLDYTTDVGPSPVWTHLATNIMSGMEWFYVDMDSPFQPRRFYRVELK
ncbi:MAG: hypothetical protein MUF81_02835 [Verrucomicrobia bacterium]|jgi:hypothetical protein|nr:hypothetical protein [Verrucomicrobiota bacterium]